MDFELNDWQKSSQEKFRAYVAEKIEPNANYFDEIGYIPADVISDFASQGYLGAILSKDDGGLGMDMVTFGILSEELGRGCSSVRSLLTVHSMVTFSIVRWGSQEQKSRWLRRLAIGEIVGAFALSEPFVGSDPSAIKTTATKVEGGFVLNGRKKWITFGQIADLILVFAQCDGQSVALIVEKGTLGFSCNPIGNMLGTSASMLAELHFDDCYIAESNQIGGIGFGLAIVAFPALDIGRYTVASGCVGIIQACLDACLQYVHERQQFGNYLKDHQLIQRMISDMVINLRAARLLCRHAGYLMEIGSPNVSTEIFVAKYFASTSAMQAASDTVQIHGAYGCSHDSIAQRLFRDAKIMEIIEGSTQIQQVKIAEDICREFSRGM